MKKKRGKIEEDALEIVPKLKGRRIRLRKKASQKPPNLVGWRPGSGTITTLVPAPSLLH